MVVRSRAPLRLGLAGGGSDVSPFCDLYGGYVLNVTIDRYAYATIGPGDGERTCFEALDVKQSAECKCGNAIELNGPLHLAKGVYARVCQDFLGGQQPSLRVTTYSDAPPGSGLGSSSTMVVALLQAFVEYFNLPLGEYDIAHLAYQIERRDLGLAGGKQDQYSATFGGFNFMEFYAGDRVVVNPLRIKDWVWAELEASLVLYFTGVSRASADIINQQSRNVSERKQTSVEAMHRLKEEAVAMKECLLKGEFRRLEAAMRAGWEAKKQTASHISNELIEKVERVAFANGARAGKISGAGGGGFMMFLCAPEQRLNLCRSLTELGGSVLDFHFTQQGAMSWQVP
jgi:D-glycero-alpha-D-manno-heptose-7-phosphate kinase